MNFFVFNSLFVLFYYTEKVTNRSLGVTVQIWTRTLILLDFSNIDLLQIYSLHDLRYFIGLAVYQCYFTITIF